MADAKASLIGNPDQAIPFKRQYVGAGKRKRMNQDDIARAMRQDRATFKEYLEMLRDPDYKPGKFPSPKRKPPSNTPVPLLGNRG